VSSYDTTHFAQRDTRYIEGTAPPYSAMCECGRRYGMHRVNDFACPNQRWSTGNGEPQWLTRTWKRA
jgi:hypothetical protein